MAAMAQDTAFVSRASYPKFLEFWDFPIAKFGKLVYNVGVSGERWVIVGTVPLSWRCSQPLRELDFHVPGSGTLFTR